MATALVPEEHRSGFNFANTLRNLALEKKGWGIPKAVKTGTTIAGVVFDGGVVLGADSRATAGTIVADKDCMKLYKLAPNMFAAGAGTAADMEHTCKNIRAQLELHRLNTGRTVPVICAVRIIKQLLFKYQGHVSAYFIVGGVDHTGPHLYEISASGCSQTVPFCSTGSGCLAALSQLESQWKMDMTEEQAKGVMRDAILAGIMNDLGSGSNVNIAVIRKDTVEYISPLYKGAVKGERPIFAPGTKADVPSEPTQRFGTYRYMKGTTAVLSTRVIPLEVESSTVHEVGEAMETS